MDNMTMILVVMLVLLTPTSHSLKFMRGEEKKIDPIEDLRFAETKNVELEEASHPHASEGFRCLDMKFTSKKPGGVVIWPRDRAAQCGSNDDTWVMTTNMRVKLKSTRYGTILGGRLANYFDPKDSSINKLSVTCINKDTGNFEIVNVLGSDTTLEGGEDYDWIIATPKMRDVFSNRVHHDGGTHRYSVGTPSEISCTLDIQINDEDSQVEGEIQFVQQDTSFEDIEEYVTVDLELDKPTWLKDVVKGDTNLGFEFESYFLELHLRNTGDTIATKDSAFPGLYYDITADIKQKDKFTWYDVEAVSMPFGSDLGHKFCDFALDIRTKYEDIRKQLDDTIVDATIKAAKECNAISAADDKMKCAKRHRETVPKTVLKRDLHDEKKAKRHRPYVEAVFPSPIVLGIDAKNGESTEETIRLVQKYGVLARPQATFCVHIARVLEFFLHPEGSAYKLRKSRLIYSIMKNIASVSSMPNQYKTWRTRATQIMGKHVMSFSPGQTNAINVDGRTITFLPKHDALKSLLFLMRMIVMRFHYSNDRKGLYWKARMGLMVRTSIVAIYKNIEKPVELTTSQIQKIVCGSNPNLGTIINHGWALDFKTGQYYIKGSRDGKNDLIVDIAAKQGARDLHPKRHPEKLGDVLGSIPQENYKFTIKGKPDGSKVHFVKHNENQKLLIKVYVVDDSGLFDFDATQEVVQRIRDLLTSHSYSFVDIPDPELEDHDAEPFYKGCSAGECKCYYWVEQIVEHDTDWIAKILKNDNSYGYIDSMDDLRTLQESDVDEDDVVFTTESKGVRFEIRSLLSIIGNVEYSKGTTVDEFLLEAAGLYSFASWLNDPSPQRARERESRIEPKDVLHDFWSTGTIRNDIEHPTQLQVSNPGHAQFTLKPFQHQLFPEKVNPEERRDRAKAAADFVFQDKGSCSKYFQGGRNNIELSEKSIQGLKLTPTEVFKMYVKKCANVDTSDHLPEKLSSLDPSDQIRVLLHAHALCKTYHTSPSDLSKVVKLAKDHMESLKENYIKAETESIERRVAGAIARLEEGLRRGSDIQNLFLDHASSNPFEEEVKVAEGGDDA